MTGNAWPFVCEIGNPMLSFQQFSLLHKVIFCHKNADEHKQCSYQQRRGVKISYFLSLLFKFHVENYNNLAVVYNGKAE